MSAAEIIDQVLDAGGQIAADGADLVLTAQRPLPPALLDQIKAHKPELLAALAHPDPLPPLSPAAKARPPEGTPPARLRGRYRGLPRSAETSGEGEAECSTGPCGTTYAGEEPQESEEMSATELAVFVHDTYERLAPEFGYETRPDTRAFDTGSPNGRLMIAVCEEVIWEFGGEM
jgi:hypothetical protein